MQEMIKAAAQRLVDAGVPSPRADAELLAAHVLGVTRGRLQTLPAVSSNAAEVYTEAVERRARREPLQHITGIAHFRHISLAVGPGVFIPRPETEVTAGAAIDEARRIARGGVAPIVVDLYSGSGPIALSVADEVPDAVVYAVEADDDAVSWLLQNCEGSSITVHHGDSGNAALLDHLSGRASVVVANPPYVPANATIRDPEVAEHDPAIALWSGTEGLDDMRALEQAAHRLLRPAGLVIAEHADVQGEAAPDIFRSAGRWMDVADHDDLAGRPRYVTARKGS